MTLNMLYMLNGTAQLIIAVFGIIILYSSIKKKRCRIGHLVGTMGVFYSVFSLLNFSWFFNVLEASSNDFTIINTFFSCIIAVLFLFVAYKLTNNQNLIYLLVTFFITLIGLYFIFQSFLLINFISLLLLLIVFLDLEFFSHDNLKKIGIAGVFYCTISLLFLFFSGKNLQLIFIPDILMIYIIYNFMQHTKSCERRIRHRVRKVSLPLQVIKFSLFIITLTVFMMFGTLSIHEIGHSLTAKFYGCSYSAVIYQSDYFPHTNMECNQEPNEKVILLGALVLTSVLALIFFFTSGGFIRYLSYLIFAFGIIIANKDFLELGLSKNIVFVLDSLAAVLIMVAISKIIMFYLEEYKKTRIVFCQKECQD